MKYPYDILKPEYERLLASVRLTRLAETDSVARSLLRNRDRYRPVTNATGVPAVVLMAIHQRESNASFNTNLGQGDPLTAPSTHVPKGRPPLAPGMTFPVSWDYAAIDALKYDHLAGLSWDWPSALYRLEAWNGFGPRMHGIHTGYLWAGTSFYERGKYKADGVWDPFFVDKQLGCVPLMMRLINQDPKLAIPGLAPLQPETSRIPTPAPVPQGLGAGPSTTLAIQQRLNQWGSNLLGSDWEVLDEDGSYGRRTAKAVRDFQSTHGLAIDGIAGPLTLAALGITEEQA